ncbi:MAG: MGMT family protein [Chlorobi bacterium]|nr:MGMT family protein [Chlorobiota bacterium]
MENDFFQKVYKVVRLIPYGKVTSYGAIAKFIGSPQAARMVGWAMNKSFSQKEFVPAHRVLNRNGMLTGKHHFGGTDTMKELLENEGHKIVNNQLVDFEKYFWNPQKECN